MIVWDSTFPRCFVGVAVVVSSTSVSLMSFFFPCCSCDFFLFESILFRNEGKEGIRFGEDAEDVRNSLFASKECSSSGAVAVVVASIAVVTAASILLSVVATTNARIAMTKRIDNNLEGVTV